MSYRSNIQLAIKLTVLHCQRTLEAGDRMGFSRAVESLAKLKAHTDSMDRIQHLNTLALLECFRDNRQSSFCLVTIK